MNDFKRLAVFLTACILVLAGIVHATGPGPKISQQGNLHNLGAFARNIATSVLEGNLNPYRAVYTTGDPYSSGQQICIFCHTPHNAVPQSTLWNRNYATSFTRYSSETLQIKDMVAANYTQATVKLDGPSKLCLSCHDGTTSLGAVRRGGSIAMTIDKIPQNYNVRSYFGPQKLKRGHHPVSFTYTPAIAATITTQKALFPKYFGTYKYPTTGGVAGMYSSSRVKIDQRSGKMECTTCHDPHQNQSDDTTYTLPPNAGRKVAPFWVVGQDAPKDAYDDHDFVCLTCHTFVNYDGAPNPGGVQPWPAPPGP